MKFENGEIQEQNWLKKSNNYKELFNLKQTFERMLSSQSQCFILIVVWQKASIFMIFHCYFVLNFTKSRNELKIRLAELEKQLEAEKEARVQLENLKKQLEDLLLSNKQGIVISRIPFYVIWYH